MTPSPAFATAVRRLPAILALIGALAAGALAGAAHARTAPDRAPIQEPAASRAALQPPADPAHRADRVLLPAVAFQRSDDICDTLIAVQNVGAAPAQAVLLTWGPSAAGECAGPNAVTCSPLMRPGGSWLMERTPLDAASGMLFSFTAQRLSDIGASAATDDLVSGSMCAALADRVVDNCGAYRDFLTAWESGGVFAGLPLDRTAGAPLAVELWRACPGLNSRGVVASASYNGIGANALGAYEPDRGGYTYFGAPVSGPAADTFTDLHIQNAGADDATVAVRLRAEGACDADIACATLTVRPGETEVWPAAACVGSGWRGSAVLESDQPLAVVVEAAEMDALLHWRAAPAHPTHDALGTPALEIIDQAAWGPLTFAPEGGWDTEVVAQNAGVGPTLLRVDFLDHGGRTVDAQQALVCAGGSATFRLPMTDELPGQRAGTVRVLSRGLLGDPSQSPPVSAVLGVRKWSDAGRTELVEAAAYNLVPAPLALSRAEGDGPPGLEGGVAAVAVPGLFKNLDRLGIATELAVADLVPEPGWTDVAVLIYDQNDLVDVLCRRLHARQVEYIDIQTLGAIDPGLRAGAVVSAVAWQHETPTAGRDRVGLAAGAVWRRGTRMGEDIPGDELAFSPGTPLRRLPDAIAADADAACSPEPGAGGQPAPPSEALPAALAGQAHLPALHYEGQDDICRATVAVRNAGAAASKAALVTFGEPALFAPTCAGALAVHCSGLMAPGATWTFDEATMPHFGAASGVLFNFNTRPASELGIPGATGTVADHMCAELARTLVGDCDAVRRFRLAYLTGGEYEGASQADTLGGPLEATVTRDCLGNVTPGLRVVADYDAPAGAAFDPWASADGFRRSVGDTLADYAGFNTIIYVQNTGLERTSADLWFGSHGDCLRHRTCSVPAIAPGEAVPFDASDCVGPSWRGSVVVRGAAPLAVVVDRIGSDELATTVAFPDGRPFDVNADGRVDGADRTALDAALGATPADLHWNTRADLDGSRLVDDGDRDLLVANMCRRDAPPTGTLARTLPRTATSVALPALGKTGSGAPCAPWVTVQNLGDEPAKALLLAWGEPAAAVDACRGPVAVACSGLVAPGGAWGFGADALPPQVASGIVFGLDTGLLSEIGVVAPGDPVVADYVCQLLTDDVVGDCAAAAAFLAAYDSGGTFGDVPLRLAMSGALAASVARDCAWDSNPVVRLATSYTGIGTNALGTPVLGTGYEVMTSPLYGDKAGFNSTLHVQNAGSSEATVEVWARSQDDCSFERQCALEPIPPGARRVVDMNDCHGPDWQGSVFARSDQPLAVLAEVEGRGSRMDFTAAPSHMMWDALGSPAGGVPATALYGPLLYSAQQGWDLGIQIQNHDPRQAGRVRVEFLDPQGAPVFVLEDTLCPLGSQTLFMPVFYDEPGTTASHVRVISVRPPTDPEAHPVPVSGTAIYVRYNDAARSEVVRAAAYDLLPAPLAGAWPPEAGVGGASVVAVPGLSLAPDAPDVTGELVIANLMSAPGRTEVAVMLFDANGPVDTLCRRLWAGQTTTIDLAQETGLPGFRGVEIVSAVFWDHEVVTPGSAPRNLVALGAVATWRQGNPAGPDGPGDELGLAQGVPLGRLPDGVDASGAAACPRPPSAAPTPWPTSRPVPTATPPDAGPSATPGATPTGGPTAPGPSATPPAGTPAPGLPAYLPYAARNY